MVRVFVEGLQPGRAYSAQFRTVFNGEYSEYSPVLKFTASADSEPPQIPSGVTASFSGDSVVVRWDALPANVEENKDLASYEVRYSRSLVSDPTQIVEPMVVAVVPSESPSHTLSFSQNLSFWGEAQFRVSAHVRSVDATGNRSNWSDGALAVNAAPGMPVNLQSQPGRESIILKWEAPADNDLAYYEIQRGTSENFTEGASTLISRVTSLGYTDTIFVTGPFWHRVYSVDKFGQRSAPAITGPNNPIIGAAVDATPPAVPEGLTVAITQTGLDARATVGWTAVGDADLDSYVIRYREAGTTDWSEVRVSRDSTTYVLDLPKSYTNYEFQIRAKDFSANYSAWSVTSTGTAPENVAPGQVTINTVTGDKGAVMAKWTLLSDPDIKHYEVQVATGSAFSNIVSTQRVNSDALMVSGLTAGQTYYVRVRAVDLQGATGEWSAGAAGTPTGFTVSFTDLEAGILQTKELRLGTDSSMVVDSTAVIKSNNYSGSFDPNAGTGWSLANNTLVVNDGSISAKALSTSTLESALITIGSSGGIRSSNFVQGVSGFKLNPTTLEISDGTIRARALELQVQGNIINPLYASFEGRNQAYAGKLFAANGVWVVNTNYYKYSDGAGGQSLAFTNTSSTTSAQLYLGGSATDYNVQVESEEVNYFVGAEIHSVQGATVRVGAKLSNGTIVYGSSVSVPATSSNTFTNVTSLLTIPNGITSFVPVVSIETPSRAIDVDGVLIAKQTGKSTTPPLWTRPGSTSMDGGQIRTGEIWSNSTTIVGGQTVPTWYINLAGEAQFGSARVLGNLVVGGSGTKADGTALAGDENSMLSSYIYDPNNATNPRGWQILANGRATFVDATVTGTINAKAGSISGVLTIPAGGLLRLGGVTGARVELKSTGIVGYNSSSTQTTVIDATTGGLTAVGANITGTINAQGGTFSGPLTVSGSMNMTAGATITSSDADNNIATLNASRLRFAWAGAAAQQGLHLDSDGIRLVRTANTGGNGYVFDFQLNSFLNTTYLQSARPMVVNAGLGNLELAAAGAVVLNPTANLSVTAGGAINMITGSPGAGISLTCSGSGAIYLNSGNSDNRFGMNSTNDLYYQVGGVNRMVVAAVGIYDSAVTSGRSVSITSANRLGYTSSTEKVKRNIVPISLAPKVGYEVAPGLGRLWDLDMVAFNYRPDPDAPFDDVDKTRQYGVIAEQAHDLGIGPLVYYTDTANPTRDTVDGFAYERHSIWLQHATKLRFEENEARMEAAESKVKSLEERLAALESLLQGQN